MTLVIDASVAIKWFVAEAGREDALAIIDFKVDLVAPDIFSAEFINILRKKVLLSEVTFDHAKQLIDAIDAFVTLIPMSAEMSKAALTYAVNLNHPAYDCIYLACAEQLGTKLVTADGKFADKLEKSKLSHFVMRLENAKDGERTQLIISKNDIDRIESLSAFHGETVGSLRRALGSTSERVLPLSSGDMQPARGSPTRRRLEEALATLTEEQILDLVALAWLGRGYDGLDFSALRDQAASTLGDLHKHIPYIIGVLRYVQSGLDIFRSHKSSQYEIPR